MKYKLVDIAKVDCFPQPGEPLTPEEEAAILAQYRAERTPEALEADYQDIEKQVAEGVPAEQLLRELGLEDSAE